MYCFHTSNYAIEHSGLARLLFVYTRRPKALFEHILDNSNFLFENLYNFHLFRS